jgi:hypothetical protein
MIAIYSQNVYDVLAQKTKKAYCLKEVAVLVAVRAETMGME